MALRDYNAAVDFVDRNVAEGRGRQDRVHRSVAQHHVWGVARRGGAHRPDAGAHGHRAGKPNRARPARHRRLSDPVLGRDPCRHRAGSAQYAADGRSVPLSSRRFARQGCLRFRRAAAGRSGSREGRADAEGRSSWSAAVRHRCRGWTRLLAAENEGSAPARTSADEVAYWLYSSGTTGMPKGVMHVHSNPMVMARIAGQRRIGVSRGRRRVFCREAVLLLWSRQRHHLPDVGRRDLGLLSGAADAANRVRNAARLSADDVLCGADALCGHSRRSRMHAGTHSSRLRLCFSAGEPLPATRRPSLEGTLRSRHRQWRRLDRDGASLPDQPSGRGRVRHRRRAGRRLRLEAGRRKRAGRRRRRNRRALGARRVSRGRLLESAREIAPDVRGRMDAHRRQVPASSRRRVHLLRPHRRHVQGQRHLGVAVRGRGGLG